MAMSPTPYLALMLPVPGSKEPFRVSDVVEWFTVLDSKIQTMDGVATDHATRLTAIEKFTKPSLPDADFLGGIIPAGTAAERDAFWGVPGDAAARLALARRGARWFNTTTGFEEQYFALWADDADKTFSSKTAGWHKNRARELPLPTVNTNGATGDVFNLGANFQISNSTGEPRLFMRDAQIFGMMRINKTSTYSHADQLMTFATGYRPFNQYVGAGILSGGAISAQPGGFTLDSSTGGNPGVLKTLTPPGGTSLEVYFRYETAVGT